MELLKKVLNPGKEREDEVLYGSGQNPSLAGTGPSQAQEQGGHLGGSKLTANEPQRSAVDPLPSSDYGTAKGQHLGTEGTSTLAGGDDQYPSSALRDAPNETSTTASILSGVPGRDQSSSEIRPAGTSDGLNTNKPLPREPTDAGLTGLGSSAHEPHQSGLATQVDPRVDSDYDRSRGLDPERPAGSGLAGTALPDRSVDSSGYGTDPQSTESTLGRDAALGTGAAAGLGAGTAATLHHKRDQDDLRAESGRSFPLAGNTDTSDRDANLTGVSGSTTAGPHSSSLANKADPRVDSDLDGSRTAGNAGDRSDYGSGYGSGTGPVAAAGAQGVLGRDGHSDSVGDAGNLSSHQTPGIGHHSHGHEFAGDPCNDGAAEGHPLFTKGPHATDTANLLDPHVTPQVTLPSTSTTTSSDTGLGSNASTALGSTAYGGDRHGGEVTESEPTRHGDHHHGRDAAVAGGLGAAGAAAYSAGREDTPSTETTSTTTGPHQSKLLNKLDPRVHTGSESSESPATTAQTSDLIGSSEPGSSAHMPTSEKVGGTDDYGRDSALAGAGGVAGYESQKHPTNFESSTAPATSGELGSSDPAGTTPRGDYDPNARSVEAGGLGSDYTEGDVHKEKDRGLASRLPGFLGGHKDKSQEPTSLGQADTTTEPEGSSGHHFIRDAGLASAGVGGGLAAYETQKVHSRDEPQTATESSSYPPTESVDSDTRRDPALTGAVGTGLGASETGVSNREAEKLDKAREKEYEKEQKAIHKEELKHEKALEKEEKQREKEEKKHEKELAKEEKKHQDDGKKHGGILGLFHRDKADKHDEDIVADQHPDTSYQGTEAAAGVGAAGVSAAGVGAAIEHEKDAHELNKLHKDPPAGYYESKGYEAPSTGDGSQTIGGTGPTGPIQGEEYPTGSQLSGTGGIADPKSIQGGEYPTGSQLADTGSNADPNVSGGLAGSNAPADQKLLIDHETGLPIDITKGTGAGGIESGTTPGFVSHEAYPRDRHRT